MIRVNQSGSIVGFVVIGVLLVAGAAGLLYWISHRESPIVSTPEVNIPASSGERGDKTPAPVEVEPSSPTNESDNTSANADEETTPAQPEASAGAAQIPQTGPADTALQIAAIGILTVATVSFARSRKYRHTL